MKGYPVTIVITTERFIKLATEKHGGKYTYGKTHYRGSKEKVTITCPEHGDFEQRANAHLFGKGCLRCSNNNRMSTEDFIAKARAKHGDKYNYSRAEYSGALKKLTISCPEHGDFQQKADSHLRGQGCKHCRDRSITDTTDSFTEKAARRHGGKYNYAKVMYGETQRDKVVITCPEHGDFEQSPQHHLDGCGCPKCSAAGPSKPETELFEFIKSISPDAVQSDRTWLGGKEIDIIVPSKHVGFEFNGLYWHSEFAGKPVNYHQNKSDMAAAAGVRLIHIFEDEWIDKRAWCMSHIRNVLNAPSTIIHARKCQLETHSTAVPVREFLQSNHIQGFRGGRSIALRYNGEIVAVAVIAKIPGGGTELARWCVKLGTHIVGGFRRVMAHIPEGTVSFCDTAKHSGAGYVAAGWTKVSEGSPSYYYTDFRIRKGRQAFQKHRLIARGALGENEVDLAASEGFYRIGGLRQLKFIKAGS